MRRLSGHFALAVLATVSAVGGAALWYGRVIPARMQLMLRSTAIELAVAPTDGEIQAAGVWTAKSVQTVGAAAVTAVPDLTGDIQPRGASYVLDGPVTLESLGYQGAHSLLAEARDGCLELSAGTGQLSLSASGARAIHQGNHVAATPGSLELTAQGLRLCEISTVPLVLSHVRAIDPTRPLLGPDSATRVSTLVSATLRLPGADRIESLDAGESVRLGDFRGVFLLALDATAATRLRLTADGSARIVQAGSAGAERDVRPRWIEFLRAKDLLGGLLASVVAVWGVLRGAGDLWGGGENRT